MQMLHPPTVCAYAKQTLLRAPFSGLSDVEPPGSRDPACAGCGKVEREKKNKYFFFSCAVSSLM